MSARVVWKFCTPRLASRMWRTVGSKRKRGCRKESVSTLWTTFSLLLLCASTSRLSCEGFRTNSDSIHGNLVSKGPTLARASKTIRNRHISASLILDASKHNTVGRCSSAIQVRGGSGDAEEEQSSSSTSRFLDCYIGLDVGTQGTKCVAYCPDQQEIVARASASYDIIPTTVTGRAEQDPQIWLDAIEECLKSVGKKLHEQSSSLREEQQQEDKGDIDSSTGRYRVAGIGVSGQQHGLVVLDDGGVPMRPAKLWCDVEASEETEYLKEQAATLLEQRDEEMKIRLDRSFLTPGFTSPKILWLKRNEPETFNKCRWMVLPHDYIVMKLTSSSQPITDVGDASGNGVFDTVSKTNVKELAGHISSNLLEKFPKIVQRPNDIAGYLNEHYSKMLQQTHRTDLGGGDGSDMDKIPISIGSGDNMCSCLGIGCVTPGTSAVLSLGTSGTLFGVSTNPVNSVESPSLAPFCDATGNYLPLACIMSCTGVLTSTLNEWCPSAWNHEDATKAASSFVEMGCSGITCLPFWGGERTPNLPHATGAFLGLTSTNLKLQNSNDHVDCNLSDEEYRGAVLYRACMEGITFCLAEALKQFPNHETIDTLYVVGGGGKNLLWRQMIADIFNCRLIFPIETETGALGAAFQAGAAATNTDVATFVKQQAIQLEPTTIEPQNHQLYQEAHERYRKYLKDLYNVG